MGDVLKVLVEKLFELKIAYRIASISVGVSLFVQVGVLSYYDSITILQLASLAIISYFALLPASLYISFNIEFRKTGISEDGEKLVFGIIFNSAISLLMICANVIFNRYQGISDEMFIRLLSFLLFLLFFLVVLIYVVEFFKWIRRLFTKS